MLGSHVFVMDSLEKQNNLLRLFSQFEKQNPQVIDSALEKIWTGFVDFEETSKIMLKGIVAIIWNIHIWREIQNLI